MTYKGKKSSEELRQKVRNGRTFRDLTDCYTGSLGVHASCNIHGGELLKQQFCSVRDMDLRNLGLVAARPAFKGVLFEVPRQEIRHIFQFLIQC